MYVETNKHLFWECSKSQQFWSELGTFLNNNNIVGNLNWHLICFGQYEINSILLNFCVLLGKYFIYLCKLRNTDPKFSDFKLYLKKSKDIERQIAINKNKLNYHEQKWNGIQLD